MQQHHPLVISASSSEAYSSRRARWGVVPLVLVVVMLLGSVMVPARETWRILHLLRETADVIEPARILSARLETGLTAESAALESYARTGDSVQFTLYTAAAADDDRRLTAIQNLAQKLDAGAPGRAAAVRARIGEWREISRALIEGRATPDVAMHAQRTSYEQAVRAIDRLASYLAAEGTSRRELIHRSERLGLLVNASLVFIALAAVFAVSALSYRERQLTRILARRIQEEAALRSVARALGGAVTTEDVLRLVADGTLATTQASGVYVECIVPDGLANGAVEFIAQDRGRPPSQCTQRPRSHSLSDAFTDSGGADALTEVDPVSESLSPDLTTSAGSRAGLVARLASPDRTLGVLVLLRHRASGAFGEDIRRQIRTLADLSSAALQRVAIQSAERRALKEAQRRAQQEEALREAAEALAAAFTIDEVTSRIARTALAATQARGAFIEQICAATADRTRAVTVRASAGAGVPALGATLPYAGSLTELVLGQGEPMLFPDLRQAPPPNAGTAEAETGSMIAVPLRHAAAPIGALFVLSATETSFGPDDLARARTFGHLAALAYEKVRLLDEARDGRAELERVMKSRSRLMRGFSHDIKNPLGAADGYAELLTSGIYGPLSTEQSERIECIRRSIRVAVALIDDLHALARAEAGRLELSVAPVDLGALARASAEEYGASAEAGGLSLSVDVPAESLVVATDRARVRQIVSNLLSNAIKYTTAGSIILRVRRWPPRQFPQTNRWVAIDVTDSGPGIHPDNWDSVFEEFTRLATDETGAGLGLAISQRLAHALGGQITIQSEVGSGSTFTLWLPLEYQAGSHPTIPRAVMLETPSLSRLAHLPAGVADRRQAAG
jgi:signal transduction histidine kinase